MALETALKLVLLGVDRSASKALRGVANETKKTHGVMGKLGGMGKMAMLGLAGAAATAGIAAVKFGGDSLAAFADADKSQKKLEDAYKRFPKVQNVSIESMRKYNQALQRKTGADADDIAAGQATLAMFKLTGKQIKDTTPLLVDYAAKTGKSLPDSAKTMGKALLGNTKALKDMGISYKSTGDPAKDYANIMDLLKDKVGGFADSVPAAEKKGKILAATFGDLQESVGEKLQPAMMGLMDAGQGVLDWMDKNPQVMEGVTAAGGLLGDMFVGIWDILRKYVIPVLGIVVEAFGRTTSGIAGMLHALGKLPGFEWAEKAADQTDELAQGILSVATSMKRAGDAPKVDTGAAVAKSEVKDLDKQIKSLKGKKVKAEAKGDTKEVDRLADKIKKLKGKKLDINAHVRKTGINGIRQTMISNGHATKFSAWASGHPSTPSGTMAWLGESGPEAVQLPTGSRVFSNGQTRAMASQGNLGGGAGGGPTIYASFSGRSAPPLEFAKYIETELYKLMRKNGGQLRFQSKR